MTRAMKTVFLCIAAMAAGLVMAQTSPAQRSPEKNLPGVNFLLGPDVSCPSQLDCPVPVKLTLPTGGGCQVTVSSKIHLAENQLLTRIVWTLSPTSSVMYPGATYAFQPDYGILVINDGGRQIARSGVGTSVTLNDTYRVYHLRSRKVDDVTYLPIVLQTVPPATVGDDPVITLCGASDPKIVNEGA